MNVSEDVNQPEKLIDKAVSILIVDDEQDLIEYLSDLLGREGFRVSGLSEPQKVIQTIKSNRFHLIVLDMMMPTMNGTEVLEQIRKVDTDIPVIVSTAYPTMDTAIASLKYQASDYVQKPFEPEAFLTTVQAVLARKGVTIDPEMKLHQILGETIRSGRKTRSLTLKQLSRRTGLSVSLLSQIERAESSASISSLFRIAAALGIRVSSLFGNY